MNFAQILVVKTGPNFGTKFGGVLIFIYSALNLHTGIHSNEWL